MKDLLQPVDLAYIEYRIASYRKNQEILEKDETQIKTPVSNKDYYLRSEEPEKVTTQEGEAIISPTQQSENIFIRLMQAFIQDNGQIKYLTQLAAGTKDRKMLFGNTWESLESRIRKELNRGNSIILSAALNEYVCALQTQDNEFQAEINTALNQRPTAGR